MSSIGGGGGGGRYGKAGAVAINREKIYAD
jgi:hypothetical protein